MRLDRSLKRFKAHFNEMMPIIVIMIIMIAINIWKQPNFFSVPTFNRIWNQLAPYILIAMAQTCIMVLGGMDFGLGPLVSLSTCLFATLMIPGSSFNLLIILAVIIIVAMLDASVGFIIGFFKLPTIVVTLATSFIFEGLALSVLPSPGGYIDPKLAVFFTGRIGILPVPMLLIIGLLMIWYVIRKSSYGISLYAIGNNKKSAFSSGLNITKAYVLGFFISGILAAIAGLMLASRTISGDPTIANNMTILSVTAAVLGGVAFSGGEGKMSGALIGAIIVGILVNVLFYLNITGFSTYLVQGIILILSVLINTVRRRKQHEKHQ